MPPRTDFNILKKLSSHPPDLNSNNITTFLNHYSYLVARNNLSIFSQFDIIHCDGILLCKYLRAIGIKKTRISFDMTSLAPEIFRLASENDHAVYFIGGEQGVAENACSKIQKAYPNLKVSGVANGFFSSEEERSSTIDAIRNLKPSIVIASMGTPYQEQFLIDLRNSGWSGNGYTSGGFFHQTAKAGLTYYPKWVNRLNLRWAYRIYDEPKLINRYTLLFIKFTFVFAYDAIVYKLNLRKQSTTRGHNE